MKQQRKFLRQLELRGQLSGQPMPGVPIVELAGEHRVLIENHCGVREYLENCVCVGVRYGHIQILGTDLRISHMCSDSLVITGNIQGIRLERSVR